VVQLTAGANAPVPSSELTVKIEFAPANQTLDISSFRLYDSGKVRGDSDMVFFGQKSNEDGTIRLVSETPGFVAFSVNINALKADVQKIAFSATCDAGKNIGQLDKLTLSVEQAGNSLIQAQVDVSGKQEAALILGELYRRNHEWKFRFISQGFNGGLKPLAEHFGVEIADEAPAATPADIPMELVQPKVSLSKVSLTKEKPKVSLSKNNASGSFGTIKINLNWNRASTNSSGFMGMFGSKNIDLDLGAFVRLKNGYQCVVQALGKGFGQFNSEPYVQLQGDDRTGAVSEGEWLHINGGKWDEIEAILVFAFIYEGAPNWDSTDGIVTMTLPDQPPIETKLTDGHKNKGMCAIANLKNKNGTIEVERVNQYFGGHEDMDRAHGWGFRWKSGSK
jgi:tellurite resistance protein TerA